MTKYIVIAMALISQLTFGFRVTRDLGYGVKTYEDSKSGRRGYSLDGGNTWRYYGGRTSISHSNYEKVKSKEELEFENIVKTMKKNGKVFIVKDGYAIDISNGKEKNLKVYFFSGENEKLRNAQRYVYISLDFLDDKTYDFVKMCSGVNADNGFDSDSGVFKIKRKIELWDIDSSWEGFGPVTPVKKIVKTGYLVNLSKFIVAFKALEQATKNYNKDNQFGEK